LTINRVTEVIVTICHINDESEKTPRCPRASFFVFLQHVIRYLTVIVDSRRKKLRHLYFRCEYCTTLCDTTRNVH